ncbi:MAG: asparagine synthase-related protein [Sphingomonas sp.]
MLRGRGTDAVAAAAGPALGGVRHARALLSQGRLGAAPVPRQDHLACARRGRRVRLSQGGRRHRSRAARPALQRRRAQALGGHRAEQRYTDAMRQAPARDALDRAQYADIRHWLPGDILTKVDRASMAVSLEAREPLLDYRLVEFAATLPPGLRIRAGQGKWLMKKALEPYLPREILYRPKMGFVTPVSAWFRKALADEAAALARSRVLAGTGWFDSATIERLAADHRSGRAEHGRTLWQLLMLERSLTRLFG